MWNESEVTKFPRNWVLVRGMRKDAGFGLLPYAGVRETRRCVWLVEVSGCGFGGLVLGKVRIACFGCFLAAFGS